MAGVIGGISLAVITVRNHEPYESKFDILISKPKIYISFYLRTAKLKTHRYALGLVCMYQTMLKYDPIYFYNTYF